MTRQYRSPEPIQTRHRVEDFSCGDAQLDDWLKNQALSSQQGRRRCTYVVVDQEDCVRGFYTLAAGGVSFQAATGGPRRNMPDPVPVMVMPRISVDQTAREDGLPVSMLKDVIERVDALALHGGVRALLVYALEDRSKLFYERYGFRPTVVDPKVLALRMPVLAL
jgi:GNAT superfamily N-acetyltransferase